MEDYHGLWKYIEVFRHFLLLVVLLLGLLVPAEKGVGQWHEGHPTGLGFVPCSVSQGQGIILLWQLGRDPSR